MCELARIDPEFVFFWTVMIGAPAAVILLALPWIRRERRRGPEAVERWAQSNRLRVVKTEYRSIRRGPFWWHACVGVLVYRVTVEDGDGRTRTAWFRYQKDLFTLLKEHVTVEWDD